MEIKSKVLRRRSGKSEGRWIIRIEYFDEAQGRKRHIERHAPLRATAKDECDRLVNELKKTQGQIEDGNKMTFADLVQKYQLRSYHPAKLHQGRKVSGIRSYRTVAGHLKMLTEFFGSRKIRHITAESLQEYREWRIEKGSRRGKERREISLMTVNRELSTLRTLTNYAFDKNWLLAKLSFNESIDKGAEKERKRRLSRDEENRLLESCQGKRLITYERVRRGIVERITAKHDVDNPCLKAILLLGMDSGLRKNEILRLNWSDFDSDIRHRTRPKPPRASCRGFHQAAA